MVVKRHRTGKKDANTHCTRKKIEQTESGNSFRNNNYCYDHMLEHGA